MQKIARGEYQRIYICEPITCTHFKFQIASSISSALDGKVLKSQACYLPVSDKIGPIISEIPLYDGAYIATGHSCWGILNGPITGLVVAQLILNLKTEVDLTKFSLP